MHYLSGFIVPIDIIEKNDARYLFDYVNEIMSHYMLDDSKYYDVGRDLNPESILCDWWVIGGRWDGYFIDAYENRKRSGKTSIETNLAPMSYIIRNSKIPAYLLNVPPDDKVGKHIHEVPYNSVIYFDNTDYSNLKGSIRKKELSILEKYIMYYLLAIDMHM